MDHELGFDSALVSASEMVTDDALQMDKFLGEGDVTFVGASAKVASSFEKIQSDHVLGFGSELVSTPEMVINEASQKGKYNSDGDVTLTVVHRLSV